MSVADGSFSGSTHNDGIQFGADGTGIHTLDIQRTSFADNHGDQAQVTNDTTSTGVVNATINGTTMTSASGSTVGGGITVSPTHQATVTTTITDNTISGAQASAIDLVFVNGSGTLRGTVSDNTINAPGADGIQLEALGTSAVHVLADNNTVAAATGYPTAYNFAGIDIFQHESATLNATLHGNTISNPGANALNGIRAQAGETGSADSGITCLDTGSASPGSPQNNAILGSAGAGQTDIRVIQRGNTTVRLPDYAGGSIDTVAVANYLKPRNDRNGTPSASAAVDLGTFVNSSGCTLP
jgi:hypothetical protein